MAAGVGEAVGATVGETFERGVGLGAGVGELGAATARAGTLKAARPSNPQVESRRRKSRRRNIDGLRSLTGTRPARDLTHAATAGSALGPTGARARGGIRREER